MRNPITSAALVLSLGVGACLFEPVEPAPVAGGFVVPAGAVPVSEGVYLAPGAEVSEEPLPPPSSDESAPVIVAAHWQLTGTNSIALVFEVASSIPIERAHLEINGLHYVITLSDGSVTIDACAILLDQQGYGCTKACVDACSCAECTEEIYETNVEGACATGCSIASHDGMLSAAPYYGSESLYADIIYNGYYDNGVQQVAGVLDSLPSCSGSVCAEAATANKVVYLGFYFIDYSFLAEMDNGALVAETQPTPEKPMMTSNNFGTGTISFPPCGGPAVCSN